MTTWLHDVDTLTSLAESPPGPVRDWANARLALRAPEEIRHLPRGPWEAGLAIAAGAPLPWPTGIPAGAMDLVGASGRLPEDPEPWVRALRPRALAGDEPDLVRLIADLGALDAELLGVVTRSEAADTVAPGLVLRWAAQHGHPLEPLAAQIAEKVARREPTLHALGEMGAVLGLPRLVILAHGPDDAIEIGAHRAESALAPPAPGHGSARRKAIRAVHALLEGRADPGSAWLRAIASLEDAPIDWVCGMAAWVRAYQPHPDDPAHSVIRRSGGEDRVLLSAARRAVGAGHLGGLEEVLNEDDIEGAPCHMLAAELLAQKVDGAGALAPLLWRHLDPGCLQVGLVGLAATPDLPMGWIATQAVGLLFARYLPTMEVLTALLEAEPGPLDRQRAWALAELADPAAFAVLQAMAAADGALGEAVAHGALLLGR